MFFGSLRETEENASDSESDLDTSSEFSLGSHIERIWSHTTGHIWNHTTDHWT